MAAIAEYLARPVLTIMPSRGDARRQGLSRHAAVVTSPSSGSVISVLDTAPSINHEMEFVEVSRADALALQAFVLARQGRYESFWFPSWQHEIPVLATADGNLTIRFCGYAARLFQHLRWRYLYMVAYGDGVFRMAIAKVTAAVDNGNGSETLTVVAETGDNGTFWREAAYLPHLACGRFVLGRLDADSLTMEWPTFDSMVCRLPLAELPHEIPAV